MFIAMKPHATQADFDAVVEKVRSLGLTPHPISGTERRVVAVVGNTGAVDPDDFAMLAGVAEALRVSQPFKLVSREVKEKDTIIDVDGVEVGGRAITVMAGPCSVEIEDQIARDRAGGEDGGGQHPARRRLQAAHQPLRVPGAARGGAEAAGAGPRGDRPARSSPR